ncbi:flagellar motor protein MotB [Cupriavidus sp. CuC1]|uniref:flagellar motor protein MotB n=1 Tax=Cupriavidus sp. CuC1 TaxID=3373131 RepID=UPI0037CF8617
MKDKPNEWVSIADLMAGTLAVVMLLLVVSILQSQFAALQHKEEAERGEASQRKRVEAMLTDMKRAFEAQGAAGLVAFDPAAGKVTLKDNVFSRGSACVTLEAKAAFASVDRELTHYLTEAKEGQIFVEGHTDSLPVQSPVTDFARFCTVYDDNYTLSAARAREARRLLTGGMTAETARRVIVAGFGDSHPLPGVDPRDARNRRVEVRFVR